jgi:bis(5'-nucleosyl)-tetraphosphatase (symmetrical)
LGRRYNGRMPTYAIGDVQGCCDELVLLLDKINFDARRDRLWFVGDLVNRGPKSAATLRLIASFGDAAISVLGNHDLFMLASADGHGKPHAGDTFNDVLNAPDAAALLAWVRQQKLAHRETVNGVDWLMVHAGVLPAWSVDDTLALAREAECSIAQDEGYFAHLRGNLPAAWDDSLIGYDRLRVIINALTRLRFCTPEGVMDFTTKTEIAPPGNLAWYEIAPRRSARALNSMKVNVVFGHWAARGLTLQGHVCGIDTGCVWGRELTALRLEDRKIVQVDCLAGHAGYGA